MKNLIRLLTISLFSVLPFMAEAQQDAMYSQYMFNTLAINPAYAGSRNVASATALFRNQWTGIDGAPKTGTFSLDAPIANKKLGVGIQLFTDRLGIQQTNGATLSASYRIRMDRGSLSFGIQSAFSQYRANYTEVSLGSSGYDVAFSQNVNKFLFNVGTGAYYNTDKFYVGLSVLDLIPNKLTDLSVEGSKQAVHAFLAAGYVFPLSDDFKLKPSFLVKAVKGAPIEGDINAALWIKDVFSIGIQYRTSADIGAMLELQATPQIRLGYAYDRSTTALRNFNSGSHEIMLRYEFGSNKGKILSPRYF